MWSPSDEAINALSGTVSHGTTYEWLCTPVAQRHRQDLPALPVPRPLPRLALPLPAGEAHILPLGYPSNRRTMSPWCPIRRPDLRLVSTNHSLLVYFLAWFGSDVDCLDYVEWLR